MKQAGVCRPCQRGDPMRRFCLPELPDAQFPARPATTGSGDKPHQDPETGRNLGLSASLESLTRVISPSAGGYFLGSFGTWAPGVVGGIIMLGTVFYAWRRIILNPDPPLPDRTAMNGLEVTSVD